MQFRLRNAELSGLLLRGRETAGILLAAKIVTLHGPRRLRLDLAVLGFEHHEAALFLPDQDGALVLDCFARSGIREPKHQADCNDKTGSHLGKSPRKQLPPFGGMTLRASNSTLSSCSAHYKHFHL